MDDSSNEEENLIGKDLVGRELLVCWEDGVWYDAVVVSYDKKKDEYKLVYRTDDAIEITSLEQRRWLVKPKQRRGSFNPVLDGAVIEFTYPIDKRRYKAMIYAYNFDASRIRVAYLDECTTDSLCGGGWDFLSESPCVKTTPPKGSDEHDLWKNYFQRSNKSSGVVKQRRTVQRRPRIDFTNSKSNNTTKKSSKITSRAKNSQV